MGKDRTTTTRQQQSGTQYQNQAGGFNNTGYSGIDPASQGYVDWQRGLAQQGAGAVLGAGGQPNQIMLDALSRFAGAPTGPGSFGGGGSPIPGYLQNLDALKSGAQGLMNPYVAGVVDPTRAEFDFLRGQANVAANQGATAAGAFGGSRHGVAQAERLGALDRAQGSQIADLMRGGYDQALQAAMQTQRDTNLAQATANAGTAGAQNQAFQNELARFQALFGAGQNIYGMSDPARLYGTALGFANQGLGPTGSVYGQSGSQTGSQTGGYTGTDVNTTTTRQPFDWLGAGLTAASFIPGLNTFAIPANVAYQAGRGQR